MTQTCQRCGTEVSGDSDVCPNCGAAITQPSAVIRCQNCHRRASSQLTICPHCGRELKPWRPYRALAAIALLLLLVAFLNFGGGWRLISEAGSAVTALIPAPATLAPPPTSTPAPPPSPTPTEIVVEVQPPPTPVVSPTPTATAVVETPVASEGTSGTDTPTATSTPPPAPETYLVRPGDTLIAIASRYDVTVDALMAFNKIKDPTALRVDQEIRIPPPTPTETPTPPPVPTAAATPTPPAAQGDASRTPPGKTDTPSPTETPTATPKKRGPKTYIVQQGDTLVGIAAKVDRSVQALAVFNKIKDPTALRINQELKIPPAKYTPPPPTPKPPTSTPTPIATPTPSITLTAPVLVNPGDGAPYSGKDAFIVLTWQNPSGLPAGVENMVHIGVVVGEDEVDWRLSEAVGQATEFEVPAWLFGQAPQEHGRAYVWYVQAASVTRAGETISAMSPVSPPSDQRRFYWN